MPIKGGDRPRRLRVRVAGSAGETGEALREPSIDLNKARMRQVVEALIALSPSPNGFTASGVAVRVRALSKHE